MDSGKIRINDDIVFECFSIDYADQFNAIIKSEDYESVITAFENAKTITIMNSIGQVIKTITDYIELGSTSKIPNYYMDENEIMRSVIKVSLVKMDINSKVKMLEEKLDTSVNETAMTLEEYKEYKIKQSKDILEQYIADHPLKSSAHGGVEATYTITAEKQNWMVQQLLTYQLEKISNTDAVLTWNESGEVCEEWTEEEFLQLLLEVKAFIYPLRAYQQTIEKQIMNCTNTAEIAAIVFDYDSANIFETN